MPNLTIFKFPGLNAAIGGTFTLKAGVEPSICTITSSGGINAVKGKLEIVTSNNGRVIKQWSFDDCLVESDRFVHNSGQRHFETTIIDRRWCLRSQLISCKFNIPGIDENFDAPLKKNLKQIVDYFLETLGIAGQIKNPIKENLSPELELTNAPAATELNNLLEKYGYKFILDTDDRFKIIQVGRGQNVNLQGLSHRTSLSQMSNRNHGFDGVKVICQPSIYSSVFELEMVGLSKDAIRNEKSRQGFSYKPFQQLDYIKGTSLAAEKGFIPSVMGNIKDTKGNLERLWAKKNMFRIYMPRAYKHQGNLRPKFSLGSIDPPLNYRHAGNVLQKKAFEQVAPSVSGFFYKGGENWKDLKGDRDFAVKPKGAFTYQAGVLVFSSYMYRRREPRPGYRWFLPALLDWEVAHHIRSPDTGELISYGGIYKIANNKLVLDNFYDDITNPNLELNGKYLEVELNDHFRDYLGTPPCASIEKGKEINKTNEDDLQRKIGNVASDAFRRLNRLPKSAVYADMKQHRIDGRTLQVKWSFGDRGGFGSTSINVDTEFAPFRQDGQQQRPIPNL